MSIMRIIRIIRIMQVPLFHHVHLKHMIGMAVVDDDELRDHPDLLDDPLSRTYPYFITST